MRLKSIVLAALVSVLAPLNSNAALVESSVGRYDVTTILTSFRASETVLKSQVWWENMSLAGEFATLVGTTFGTPNLGIYAPFFWYTDTDTTGPCAGIGEPFAGMFWDHRAGRASPVCAASAPNGPFTFAIARSVTEPATVALLVLGFAAAGYARRRRGARV